MTDLPRLSVLMPVYNGANYLQEAVESVLAQTYRDFEFIIVDDGSEDETQRILAAYRDARLRILRFEQHQGIVAALNEGLRQCRGEYIARMDADDRSLPHRFEKQVRFLTKHPEVGVCGSWVRLTGARRGVFKPPVRHEDIFTGIIRFWVLVHPAVMLRRGVLEKHEIRYDPEFEYMEDKELWSRLVFLTKFHNLPEVLLEYRRHPAQLTQNQPKVMGELICRIKKRYLSLVQPDLEGVLLQNEVVREVVEKGRVERLEDMRTVSEWFSQLKIENRKARVFPVKTFDQSLIRWQHDLMKRFRPKSAGGSLTELWRMGRGFTKGRLTAKKDFGTNIAFYLQAYKDEQGAYHAIQRLRKYYPKAPVILVSDGDPNPFYTEIARKFGVIYKERRERLFLIENGGRMLHEMLDLYLRKTNAAFMMRMDTDTRCDRAFHYLPPASFLYGNIISRQGCLQGGCVLFPRAIAKKLYETQIFLDPKLLDYKKTWGRPLQEAILEERVRQGLTSFDWVLHWACLELGIQTRSFEEIHSRWKESLSNFGKNYAFVHPDKTLLHRNWRLKRFGLFVSAVLGRQKKAEKPKP